MRVGVYLGAAGPEHGGIYTFVRMQLDALLDLASGSRHRFVLLSHSPSDGRPLPESVKVVRLDQLCVPQPRERGGGLFRRRRSERETPPSLDQIVEANDLDCVWPLEAWHPPFEVPYLTPVWDIQHRLQPWFPEVSRDGEWARREARLAPLLRRAAFVIVGTQAGKQEVEAFYNVPAPRIRILPHPTPTFALAARSQQPQPLPADLDLAPGYLFYPAQFWPHKNHVGLLRALRALRDEHGLEPPLALTGADHGNLQAVRRAAKDLGVEAQVRFLGVVSTEMLVALYQNALALTYVSLFGPENLPPLEAFALGCPVIASDVPGAEEQMGDAALRVDTLDPKVLAAAIQRVHGDAQLRASLVERGRERAPRWSPVDFVRGVLGILDELEPHVACWRGPETQDDRPAP